MPPGFKATSCRSCGAAIFFGSAGTGKAMPLDATPDPVGRYVIDRGGGTCVALRVVTPADGAAPRYSSHFSTCPNAAQHRRAPRARDLR